MFNLDNTPPDPNRQHGGCSGSAHLQTSLDMIQIAAKEALTALLAKRGYLDEETFFSILLMRLASPLIHSLDLASLEAEDRYSKRQ